MAASRTPTSGSGPSDLILGRYRRRSVVGAGSFGRVIEVVDVQANEPRALKIVPRGPHELMLLDEFAQLARLRHPSLPRVYEVGRTRELIENLEAGSPFFVAEWIAGVRADSKDARAWSGTDATALWALLADIAGALATIHAAGVVHADVAPQNILVTGDGRNVLVDLGLAGASAAARGTPAYMAPEALAGFVEPRSDLYGLGATTVRLVTGRPPFEGATLAEVVQRIMRGAPARALPGIPAPLADLVNRLVARDADARPASALAVLDELDQLAPALAPGSSRRARPKVSPPPAPSAWPGADAWIATLESSLAARAVTIVHGPSESGARMLVDVALRRRQLDEVARGRAPAPMVAGTLDTIAAQLGITSAPSSNARAWIERTARAIRGVRAPVVVETGDDPRTSDLVAALARLVGDDPVIVLVDGAPRALPPGVALHPAPSLDTHGVSALAQAMLGQAVPRTWAAALHAASSGQPLSVIELVSSVAEDRDPFAIDWSARSSVTTIEHRTKQIKTLAAGPRRALSILATLGGRARVDRVLAVSRACVAHASKAATDKARTDEPLGDVALGDITQLERAQLVRRHVARDGAQVSIDRATSEAIETAVGAPALAAIAARALAGALPADPPDVLAPLLERAPLDAVLGERACRVAETLLAGGRGDRALAIAKRAMEVVPARAGLVAARAASQIASDATGYRMAAEHARAAIAAGANVIEAELVIARAAQRAGDLDAAEHALAALHRAHPEHGEVAGAYARLLVTRSRYAEAREVALAGNAALSGLRAEAAGLAAFYLGDLEAADTAFAAFEVASASADDHANVGRALSLRGMVAQQRGQLGLASDRYREAARRLSDVGELHAAATAELNLGTVLAERGRASEALPRLAAAGRVFAELGATTELIAADLNRGNALVAVGQPDDARIAAEAALARADNSPHLRAFALLVLGDARRRLGDESGALTVYREALAIGLDRGDAHAQVHAYIALTEAGTDAAANIDVDALCASEDDRDRWVLARARLALRDPRIQKHGELARACAEVAARAAAADRLDRAFRAHALAAQLASRARDHALATSEADRARAVHAALLGAAAPAFRAALEADPDLATLPGVPRTAATRATTTATTEMPLRRLLSLSRRLNSEASVDRILDEVIDTAIELTSAERGFLLLRQPDGELAAVVSRNFTVGESENQSISRSIAQRAAQTGEPVMTVDAGVDERFGAAASVAALRLRSVLAVPMRQRGAIIGCIYVDHRLRGGAFDDTAASVLGELADIAAIAIENARLADDLRRKSHEVDELNGRLSAELADKDAELVRVKSDLPDRDRLQNRYPRIVGRSPAIVKMLDVVDRAAATALPVVIVGESGTGKELVARALHDNGLRKAGAFVAINCSAVPEPLLESELFGHVRGSFTGADRDRRGLFEVADGGTLFLDEIADTSLAMQAKLLRVLQDGMIRRVGDTKTKKVDVRVIAASQHSLAELVTSGRFREDLRFRLEVISIAVPALRDRDGDVPLLVEQLLAALVAGKPSPRLTRAAFRALAAHRWPGNVRELENALARGLAMGGDVIDLPDLPEAIANAAARPEPAKPAVGEDLRLKPALASTEQAYISAAMSRAKGNQTVAARLLGLSRFGLQKKLRRLSGDDDASGDDE
ncbi:MAG: sigma 54-interacting transcriptional regulator [Myxococcota bacterium]|nr:sigma 54-interacting transcriptional regulator [Myxococcota bacterium]